MILNASSLRRILPALALLLCVLLPRPAHADPIVTASLSAIASGTLGAQSFTNQLVTFTATFDLLPEWSPDSLDPTDASPYTAGPYTIDTASLYNLHVTMGVAGLGAYGIDDVGLLSFGFTDPTNLSTLQLFWIGDSPNELELIAGQINPEIGPDCYLYAGFYCPVSAQTTGGQLILTSELTPAAATVEISGAATPEPETLLLTATGLLTLAGTLRRRIPRP